MDMIEILKVIVFGIVEGITEWLPISSTGHMILLDEFIKLDVRPAFWDVFLVVIQLGAILAVVFLYWNRLFPFTFSPSFKPDKKKFSMWFKILVASVPAGIVGILFDDLFNELFYNYITVATMLILFGILFIGIENKQKGKLAKTRSIADITYKEAFIIGIFQTIAAIFPGTSRSGATILGALSIGISRTTATEFTFFLAIPAMFGGSAIKLLKAGIDFTFQEWSLLLLGMLIAFIVSILAIKFLLTYIKKNDFKIFGWYRIVLGILVFVYFLLV